MRLDVTEFFKYFIIHPDSDLLDHKEDRVAALISSIALGIFTLGLCHLVCAVAFRSYKPIEPGSRTVASDVARRVLDANPLTKSPIDKAAADRERLEKLGFTSEDVYTKIQGFLSSSNGSLSLGSDRIITIRDRVLSLNFSDDDKDINFLLQKALERGKVEAFADFDKLFFRALQVYQALSLDDQEIIAFQPFINLEVKEESSDGLKKEMCLVPASLLLHSPILQRIVFGSSFSFVDNLSITLPENYSIEHFKAYVDMSTHADYDFSAEDVPVLLDMLQLADYFEDRELVSRLDSSLKARIPTLEDVAHLLGKLHLKHKGSPASLDDGHTLLPSSTYLSPLEAYISPFINALIRDAIVTDKPLDELVAQLHSLDISEWFKTHTLALDLSKLGSKVNDAVLEKLSGLKISDLNIASSEVMRLPDAWLTSIHNLDVSETKMAVLQALPELKGLKALKCDLTDITSLDGNTNLESIFIRAPVTRVPIGLINLKKFAASECFGLTDLSALNGCASLEELDLMRINTIKQVPAGLTRLKRFRASVCVGLTDLNALNDCANLEAMTLAFVNIKQVPTGLTGLKNFYAFNCPRLTDLDILNNCTSLEEMHLSGLNIERLPLGLTGLKKLQVDECRRLVNLYVLNGCKTLQELYLSNVNIELVPVMLTGLKKLRASLCPRLDIDTLTGCAELKELDLRDLPIERVPADLKRLERFHAEDCPRLTDLRALSNCTHLKELEFFNLESLEQISADLKRLERFRAVKCPRLLDLNALNDCASLKVLYLAELDIEQVPTGLMRLKEVWVLVCRKLRDLDALNDCGQVTRLTLVGLENLTRIPSRLREVEKIQIVGCPLITAA